MPRKISEDRYSVWNINGDDKTWTLEQQATITVNDEPAVSVLAGSTGNIIDLLGDIVATGEDGGGIEIMGADTKVVVGGKSVIEAAHGIDGNAIGFRVVNKGEIDAIDYGVTSLLTANIRNDGEIRADYAVVASSGGKIVNGKDADIHGSDVGVLMGVGAEGVIINHGTITGGTYAMSMSTGDNRIINTGTINGRVQFHDGDDVFNTSKGKAYGDVYGGDGDDTYRIGKNSIDVIENVSEGHDRVYSKASYNLGNNIETLYLVGKQDASGQGNYDDNFILGNRGDNTISGGDGNDYVGGGAGDDMLIGDDGDDAFMFRRGDDKDTVADFVQGQDVIWMTGFDGVTSFADLQDFMSQHGSDTWIQMGQGDRLIIEGVNKDDLLEDDFSFYEFAT